MDAALSQACFRENTTKMTALQRYRDTRDMRDPLRHEQRKAGNRCGRPEAQISVTKAEVRR